MTFKAGQLNFGGTNITSTGTTLTENKTKVGSKTLGTYVGDIVAGKLTADDVTIKCSLNVGSNTYYLRMGKNWTKNPEVSGLNVGTYGINASGAAIQATKIQASGKDCGFECGGHAGKTTSFYSIVSNLSVGTAGKITWKTRTMEVHGGLVTSFSDPEDHEVQINIK